MSIPLATPAQPLGDSDPATRAVLTKATLRAADLLELQGAELAAVLGVSPASVTRLRQGSRDLDPASKEGELARLFLRVFRGLDSFLGGDEDACRQWLRAPNHHLAGVPAEQLKTVTGLVHAVEYLDALRGTP